MDLQQRTGVREIAHGLETRWFSGKEKVPAAAVHEEDHADSFLRHEKINPTLFHRKRWNDDQCFLLPNS